jgi:hypothetical protein
MIVLRKATNGRSGQNFGRGNCGGMKFVRWRDFARKDEEN